jgi:molybdopterin biosynthesis enzyme
VPSSPSLLHGVPGRCQPPFGVSASCRGRGLDPGVLVTVRVPAGWRWSRSGPRLWRSYLRGVIDRNRGLVTPLSCQGSHQMATLGQANALIIVPEWVVQMDAGETVDVLELA